MATAIPESMAVPALIRWQYAVDKGVRTILDLLDSLPWFRGAPDWTAWRSFLCAAYGLPMTGAELAIYQRCTGRQTAPTEQAREVWMVCGRRSRKSALAALMAVWAGLKDYSAYVAPGERPWIPILAKSREDAQQIKRFAEAILADLQWLKVDHKADELRLESGVDLVIRAAKVTAGRSRACPLAALDEVAFFPTEEAAQPDAEIIRGIRPGMATIPGAMLVGLSSPYACRGALYEAHRDHYGRNGDPVLVWQADTLTMQDTPQLRQEIATEYVKDPESAKAEYGAQFRTDVVAYISEQLLMACTIDGRTELPPVTPEEIHAGVAKPVKYLAFVDVSGGAQDSFALAIAHWDREKAKAVLDLIAEWRAPFSPEMVTGEAATILKRYRVEHVKGDKYAGEWPRDRFAAHGIGYQVTKDSKSEIYRDAMPAFTSGRVELLDLPRLRAQYMALDRRVMSGGREQIDHPPGGRDDACLPAGVLVATLRGAVPIECVLPGDRVLVPGGTARVTWAGKTGVETIAVRGTLLATANHPVFCRGAGFRPFLEAPEDQWERLTIPSLIRWASLRSLNSAGSSIDSWGPDAITSASQLDQASGGALRACTSLFGRLLTGGRFRQATRSIIEIATRSTICLTTWSVYRLRSIAVALKTSTGNAIERCFGTPMTNLVAGLGTAVRRVFGGIASTLERWGSAGAFMPGRAWCAESRSATNARAGAFVVPDVGSVHGSVRGMTSFASNAAERFGRSAPDQSSALSDAAASCQRVPVYNISVEDAECFYANGVLVHNCNACTGSILEAYRIGKHYEVEAPKYQPKTLTEMRAQQHTDAWAKLIEGESEAPIGRGGMRW